MHRPLVIRSFAGFLLSLMAIVVLLLTGILGTQAQTNLLVWSQVQDVLPQTVDFTSVFMVDQNNAWVAGTNEEYVYIAKIGWDGTQWKLLKEAPLQQGTTYKLSIISDDNIWATGGPTDGSTGIMHYDG